MLASTPHNRMAARGALLLFALAGAGGCSLVNMRPPARAGQVDEAKPRTCTTSYANPIVDTVLAGLLTAGAVSLAVEASNQKECSPEEGFGCLDIGLNDLDNTGAAILGTAAVLDGLSAVYGYTTVSTCRSGKLLESHPFNPNPRATSLSRP